MKKLIYAFAIVAMGLSSCSKDNTVTVDTSLPNGTFTPTKTGTFTAQNATPTAGTAQLGTDSKSIQFLKFGSDFKTEFGTGTVTIYLSTTMTFTASPGTGNPNLKLVGIVPKAGENYFKIDPAADPKFAYVIIWCGTANIPFGNAKLN